MDIMVNGEKKELIIKDRENRFEWTEDLVQDDKNIYYDHNIGSYVTDPETFAWWENTIGLMRRLDYAESKIEERFVDLYGWDKWDGQKRAIYNANVDIEHDTTVSNMVSAFLELLDSDESLQLEELYDLLDNVLNQKECE